MGGNHDKLTDLSRFQQQSGGFNRRKMLTAQPRCRFGCNVKTASAAPSRRLGQTGAPTTASPPLPLGPLSGARYPDARLESMKKPTFRSGRQAFRLRRHHGGRARRDRVPLGRRPGLLSGWRYVLFSDIPNNRIMRFLEMTGISASIATVDELERQHHRPRRTPDHCEHSGRRVTRTELDGSITIIADKYNGKN
jgi:gluconolactonase